MEKLKEMVVKVAIAKHKHPLSSSQISLIDQRLHQAFPGLCLPNHPTYASMINKAIEELNEEGGSSEVSISEYIKGNFEGLPWAHKSYLSHHLNKLCDGGFLVFNADERYSIPLSSEVEEFNLVNQTTTTRHRTAFIQDNELIEAEIHGTGDEHSTSLSVLIENPTRKGKAEQERCYAVITKDESQDEIGNKVLSLEHVAELIVAPNKSGSSGIKRRQKEVMMWADGVVCGLPAKLPDPRQCTSRKKMRSNRNQTPARIDYPRSKLQQASSYSHQPESKIVDCKESKWPSWVQSLLQTRFFGECEVHSNTKKRVCNFYCLNCMNGTVCALCVKDSHEDHRVIRIRRTPYGDAVNIAGLHKYLDISGIHTHKINASSCALVSLKRMAPSRTTSRGTTCSPCICCNRRVPNQFCFCSLSCKYKHQMDVAAPSIIN